MNGPQIKEVDVNLEYEEERKETAFGKGQSMP